MSGVQRGEIYWVQLDPSIGSEVQKTRPGLVVSNNISNQNSSVVTVLPITLNVSRIYPFEVLLPANISGLTNDSKAQANQIRTVDTRRLSTQPIGMVNTETMLAIAKSLKIHLDIASS